MKALRLNLSTLHLLHLTLFVSVSFSLSSSSPSSNVLSPSEPSELSLESMADFESTIRHFVQDTIPTPIDYSSEATNTGYVNALIAGLNPNLFAVNATNCINRWVRFYYYELPLLTVRFYYGDTTDMFFNSTYLLSNISNHLMVCNNMA